LGTVVVFLLLLVQVSAGDRIEVVDDSGAAVSLAEPANRIVALYGAFNEILAAMGLEDRIIARTRTDRVPRSIIPKPSIGTHMRPNVELVVALKPDLVLQSAGRRQAMLPVNQLRAQGLPVAVFDPRSFAELFSVIGRLGTLTGEPGRAAELTASMRKRLEAVDQRLRGRAQRPKIVFEVRYPNLLTAGLRSIVNDVIEKAHATNCVTVDKKLVRVGLESLIQCAPQYYVVQRGPMNKNPMPLAQRPNFALLPAVAQDRVLFVDEQVFSRAGPRSVLAVERLAAFVHPCAGSATAGETSEKLE
jgi:iron complex transport system substrate-binding protein